MKKFVIYDTETGGLNAKDVSLLSATFRVTDAQLQTIESLSLKIKPDDGVYRVSKQALEINRIDLVKHDAEALTYKEAKAKILNFLSRHSGQGMEKLTPVGHNINFDDSFIQTHIMNKLEWEAHVSYRKLDTASISEFLKFANIIPGSMRGSLTDIAKFFGVHEDGAHNDAVDVNLTTNVLKAMKQRVIRFEQI